MVRGVPLAVFAVACATAANAQQPLFKDPLGEIRKSPLSFYVARGEDNACGLDCSEWIVAEGYFDSDAANRFRNFLTRLGKRKLPIFFHSSGGLQHPAQAIGRLLRERDITAGVARTLPLACIGADVRSCDSVKKAGKDLDAHWSSIHAQCNSACVYALVGARRRIVPPGSSLGIHSPKQICKLSDGTELATKDPRCRSADASNRVEVGRYFRQMGIDPALIETAYRTPHENLRLLSREEITRFGIDRSDFRESPWMIKPESPTRLAKFINEASTEEPPRIAAIEIGCLFLADKLSFAIEYIRSVGPEERRSNATVAAIRGDQRHPLSAMGAPLRLEHVDSGRWFQRYSRIISADHFDIGQLKIEIKADDSSEESIPVAISSSDSGLVRAWKAVSFSCVSPLPYVQTLRAREFLLDQLRGQRGFDILPTPSK